MNCAEAEEILPLYLSGELRGPQAAKFAAHLRGCPACAWDAQQQSYQDQALREAVYGEEVVASEIHLRVMTEIGAGARVKKFPATRANRWDRARRSLAVGALAAAALMLAVLGNHSVSAERMARTYRVLALDHEREVVENHWRPWLVDGNEIARLASAQGVPDTAMHGLTVQGYRLVRGKLCMLDGTLYVHLVYLDGAQEFSAFFRTVAKQKAARGAANGEPRLQTADVGTAHLARFDIRDCHAFFVSSASHQATMRMADAAARGM